jgi:hypothetical protein
MLAFSKGSIMGTPLRLLSGVLVVSLRPFIMALENFQNFEAFPSSRVSMCLSHYLFFSARMVLFLIASILLKWVLSSGMRVERHVWKAFRAFLVALWHYMVHHGF